MCSFLKDVVLLNLNTSSLSFLFFNSWDARVLDLVPFDETSLWLIGDNQGNVQICQIVSQMEKKKRKKNVRTLTDN